MPNIDYEYNMSFPKFEIVKPHFEKTNKYLTKKCQTLIIGIICHFNFGLITKARPK
jgi:hypothetical protein